MSAIIDKATVDVYDSLYSSTSASMKQQIAALFSTSKESIELRFIDVQKQSGTNDCGLYAIAYVTALCFGKSPSGLVFDQSLMRKHLHNYFEQSNMTMFPVLKIGLKRISEYPNIRDRIEYSKL